MATRAFFLRAATIGVLAAAGGGALLLSSGRRHAEAKESDDRIAELARGPRVQAGRLTEGRRMRTVTLTAEVHAYRKTTLFAKVSGYLKAIRVEKGDRVREGQVIGVLESPETDNELASKRADLAVKKLADERLKLLGPSGVVSQQERERAEADEAIASSELARLAALQGYQVIRAPFDGIVTARYADPGALLQAATSSQAALPLVDVADVHRVRVQTYLAQEDALAVHEGDAVTLFVEGREGHPIEVKVTRYTRQIDPRTRTMLTEIEVDNQDGALYPGTFVRARFSLGVAPSKSAPAEAIVFQAGRPGVFVVKDGHARLVPVETSDHDGQTVRLVSGDVAPGDLVVLHPGDDVFDGSPVQPVEQPAK